VVKYSKVAASIAAWLLLGATQFVAAAEGAPTEGASSDGALARVLRPDAAFAQLGSANLVRTASLGLVWERREPLGTYRKGVLTLLSEVSVGRWWVRADGRTVRASNSQFGVTPTLRFAFASKWGTFIEGGIGANLITPTYRAGERRFSTVFNFGDHIAVGAHPWGKDGGELALRVEHFSNAGIKHPNPGQNFVQLRWTQPL